ncbi:hypothetical protein WJX74_006815 [Apatococcus lobatus]|uniref:Right handed beta helix domain-containing protein n=1 Tax=Apatococcus lobatus TaxID=904363 RepID=A0AAW1SEU9_9CHLO
MLMWQTYIQIQNSRFDNNHCWNEIICHSVGGGIALRGTYPGTVVDNSFFINNWVSLSTDR